MVDSRIRSRTAVCVVHCKHLHLANLTAAISIAAFAHYCLADELHLSNGFVEGRVLEKTRYFTRIETASGVLTIPVGAVARRVEGPSRLERYEAQYNRAPLTSQRHLEMAKWCRSVGLELRARKHVDAALSAEPQDPAALRMAGYVQLDEVWIKAGGPADFQPDRTATSAAMVDRLVADWHRPIRAIYERYLVDDRDVSSLAVGRAKLLALREPLAIQAACRTLGDEDLHARLLLIEFLGSFQEDVATLNLLVMTLFDPARPVRNAAATQLTTYSNQRVGEFLRLVLRCQAEVLVRRAANVLGWMADRSAAEDLIEALPTAPRPGQLTAAALFDRMIDIFSRPSLVALGEAPFQHSPSVEFAHFRQIVSSLVTQREPPAGPFRSDVQDALIQITGENFGFDIAAWHDWAARNPPIGPTHP